MFVEKKIVGNYLGVTFFLQNILLNDGLNCGAICGVNRGVNTKNGLFLVRKSFKTARF